MKIYFYYIILLFLTALTSCHGDEKFSSPLWSYSYSSITPSKSDSVLNRASYLDLQPDGSYTQDFGQFDYGSWTLKGQELYLTNQNHKTYIFRLLAIGKNKLDIYLGKDKIAYFVKQPRPSGNPLQNPFSQNNNQWRVPAKHKENTDEIRQRLLNHYQFWEAYFKWGSDNNIGAIDVTDIPTPMKVYGNGLGLRRYDDLSPRWRSCFFDEEDCHRADTLLKGLFRRNKIRWPNTDDQAKLFISGVQQVEGFLR